MVLPESRLSDLQLSPFHILNPPREETVLAHLFSHLPTHPHRHQTRQILQELPEINDQSVKLLYVADGNTSCFSGVHAEEAEYIFLEKTTATGK